MGRISVTKGWVYTVGRLLWTGNAGATWSDITPAGLLNCPAPDICDIVSPPVFLDSSRVRLVVVRGKELVPPTTLSFMYTENGGRTWGLWPLAEFDDPLLCPGPACIHTSELEFPDSDHGWLAAYAPLGMSSVATYMYRTRDGGQTWTVLTGTVVEQIRFPDALYGWAKFGHGLFNNLLRTRDGGDTWEGITLGFLPAAYAEAGLFEYQKPVFLSREVGILPVRLFQGEPGDAAMAFYLTRNRGDSWNLASILYDPDLENRGSGVPVPWSAIDESTWYVWISESGQYLTRDRGLNWETLPGSGLGGFVMLDVQFASDTEGWGIGQNCTIEAGCSQLLFTTHDGGRNWTPLAPAP